MWDPQPGAGTGFSGKTGEIQRKSLVYLYCTSVNFLVLIIILLLCKILMLVG